MEKDNFWNLVPTVKTKLWNRLRNRFAIPSSLFAKRMGLSCDTPAASLETFFEVQGVRRDNCDMLQWVPQDTFRKVVLSKVFDDICENCLGKDLRSSTVEGSCICASCGYVASECAQSPSASAEHYGPSVSIAVGHSDKPRRVNQYIYKRCNHFRFWLARVQAKESSGAKANVIEAVRRELAKERIGVGDPRITYDKVRSMLKKLRLTKFYNHGFFITSILSGREAPQLTLLQEERLVSIFHAVQVPFARHCPKDRVNMMSYAYLLRKMAEALGWYEFASYFPLLKSRAKVYQQDRIWQHICAEINLPFTKSIA